MTAFARKLLSTDRKKLQFLTTKNISEKIKITWLPNFTKLQNNLQHQQLQTVTQQLCTDKL